MKRFICVSRCVTRGATLLAGLILTIPSRDAFATSRQWTGNAGAPFAWSAANNWSPTGAPQAGDDLVFQNMFSSSNDMSGVVVQSAEEIRFHL